MKYKIMTVALTGALLLTTGCQGFNNEQGIGETDTKYENVNDRNVTRTNHGNNNLIERVSDRNRDSLNRNSNNHQDRYDVSEKAAERIVDEIPEISQAYVLMTRNNAYVAAVLDKANQTPKDNLAYNDRQNSSTGTNVKNTNDRNMVQNRTVNEGNANERRQDNHIANRRHTVSDDVAKKRDAESDEVNDAVKNQIADIVQEEHDNIDNIYVSTSPDFIALANNYVERMENGEPIEGFFDQIGNMIERIFPQNKR